ncbi:MAG: hypothetical protein JWP80_1427, partial [Pseudomonas sp.]|nr:hypothetical protein [Pseudomonas sp.]
TVPSKYSLTLNMSDSLEKGLKKVAQYAERIKGRHPL